MQLNSFPERYMRIIILNRLQLVKCYGCGKYKITTQDQKVVQWKVCSLYYLMLTVCLVFFLGMAWGQAENHCNKYGRHLFSFGEEKDIRVIKDFHDQAILMHI